MVDIQSNDSVRHDKCMNILEGKYEAIKTTFGKGKNSVDVKVVK